MQSNVALRARLLELQAELQRRSIVLTLARTQDLRLPPLWVAAGTAAASHLIPRRLKLMGLAWGGVKLLRRWARQSGP